MLESLIWCYRVSLTCLHVLLTNLFITLCLNQNQNPFVGNILQARRVADTWVGSGFGALVHIRTCPARAILQATVMFYVVSLKLTSPLSLWANHSSIFQDPTFSLRLCVCIYICVCVRTCVLECLCVCTCMRMCLCMCERESP